MWWSKRNSFTGFRGQQNVQRDVTRKCNNYSKQLEANRSDHNAPSAAQRLATGATNASWPSTASVGRNYGNEHKANRSDHCAPSAAQRLATRATNASRPSTTSAGRIHYGDPIKRLATGATGHTVILPRGAEVSATASAGHYGGGRTGAKGTDTGASPTILHTCIEANVRYFFATYYFKIVFHWCL